MTTRTRMDRYIDTVLFDLDGTLLDTHRDLCAAVNVVLESRGKPALPDDVLRPFVSRGAMAMLCVAFQCQPESDQARQYRREMLETYEHNIARYTELFPGMDAILEKIVSSDRKWGIVTNKPGYFTGLLLDKLEMPWKPHTVVSGDTLDVKKPSPEPLLKALADIGARPVNAVYVGDDERDVQAGKRAGVLTIAVTYGYHIEEGPPSSWGANVLIDHPSELLDWLP